LEETKKILMNGTHLSLLNLTKKSIVKTKNMCK